MISVQDIEKLALLSRLNLNDKEKEVLAHDMSAILGYVDQLKKAPVTDLNSGKIGDNRNVMRDDEVKHGSDEYTENLLNSAPKRDGRFVSVKKIL